MLDSRLFQACYNLVLASFQSDFERFLEIISTRSILSKYDDNFSRKDEAELITFNRSPDVSDILF